MMNINIKSLKISERNLLYAILAIICLTPLPFGSDRPFPLAIITLFSGILSIYWGTSAAKDASFAKISLKHIKLPAILILITILWAVFQNIPFNISWLSSDYWHAAQKYVPKENIRSSISVNQLAAWNDLFKILSYIIIFWLTLQLSRNTKNTKKILLALSISGLIYAIYGISLNFFGINKIFWYEKTAYTDSITSTFVNRNNYATYAGLTLITSLALLLDKLLENASKIKKKEFSRIIVRRIFTTCLPHLLMVIIILTALTLSNSRAGIASSAIGILSFIIFSSLAGSKKKYRKSPLVPLLLIAPLFSIIVVAGGNKTTERFSQVESDASIRGAIYSITTKAIADTPISGVGLGGFTDVFKVHRDESIPIWMDTITDHAHNSYLELALELGIPVFLILMAVFFIILHQCVKGILNRKKNTYIPTIATSSTLLIATHSLFDFSAQIPAVMIIFLIILATGLAQSWSSQEKLNDLETNKSHTIAIRSAIVTGIILILGSAWQFSNYYTENTAQAYKSRGLAQLEQAFAEKASSPKITELLNNASRNFEQSISLAPIDAYSWAYLTYTNLLQRENNKLAANMLATSIRNNFYDKNLIKFRVELISTLWDFADEDDKRIFTEQLKLAK